MTAQTGSQVRTTVAALLLLPSLFLVLYAATVSNDRLPGSFRGDESTYFLMTRSLWVDGDLLWTYLDARYVRDHLAGRLGGVTLMTPERGDRVYYAKPFLYSILSVPFFALLGINGLYVFNALMYVLMTLLGFRYLGGRNSPLAAMLLAGTFFLFTASLPYIFWAQPEVLNMLTLFLGCYFWLPGKDRSGAGERPGDREPSPVGLRDPVVRVGLAGFFFALSAFSKLPHWAFGVILVLHCLWSRRWGRVVTSMLAFLMTLLILHMSQLALTETPSAYHSTRKIFHGINTFPHNVPSERAWQQADEGGVSRYGGGGMGLARLDGRAAYNVKYLLTGRHTGLFPYFFPGLALLLLWFWRRRNRQLAGRGFLLLGLLLVLTFTIIWFPDNYQGGPDFVGNRHAACLYPAFIFFAGSMTGIVAPLASWTVAGLFLAQVVFAPFGAVDPRHPDQLHVRAPLFSLLPCETTLRHLQGYTDVAYGVSHTPKRYLVRLPETGFALLGSDFRLQSREAVELLVESKRPMSRLLFRSDTELVEAWCGSAPGEPVRSGLLRFSPDPGQEPVMEEELHLAIEAPQPAAVHLHWRDGERRFIYHVGFRRLPGESGGLAGHHVTLAFLGQGEPWLRDDYFRGVLLQAEVPESLPVDGETTVPLSLVSRSPHPWDSTVRLSYHWRRAGQGGRPHGPVVVWNGIQTLLPDAELLPGGQETVAMQVRAPEEPGDYILELDLVADQVAWFASRSPDREPLGRFPVRVEPVMIEVTDDNRNQGEAQGDDEG